MLRLVGRKLVLSAQYKVRPGDEMTQFLLFEEGVNVGWCSEQQLSGGRVVGGWGGVVAAAAPPAGTDEAD
ncbi:hypothetical protein J6590_105675, partial [Homalodisca vitripennis]